MDIGNFMEVPKGRLSDQARASIFNHPEFIFLNTVMHILLVVILGIIVLILVIPLKMPKVRL